MVVDGEAGLAGDVDEGEAERRAFDGGPGAGGWGRGLGVVVAFLRADLGLGCGGLLLRGRGEGEDVGEGEDERGAAEGANEFAAVQVEVHGFALASVMGSGESVWRCQGTLSMRSSGMFAEVVEGVGGSAGVDVLHGVLCGLICGLLAHAEAAVEDGEVVVGGEVVGVDGLQGLEGGDGVVDAVGLVVGDAEFAEGIAGLRVLGDDFFEVGDGGLGVALAAFDDGEVVEGASVVGL